MKEYKLTRGNIAPNVKFSPYKFKVYYSKSCYIVYLFSSELYKKKFEEKLEENREKINSSLSNRFGFDVENNVLCDLKLYSSIEKRGFYIRNNKEGFECLRNLKLDGKIVTVKN